MKFLNEEHRKAFFNAASQYGVNPMDRETGPMLYLLTASYDCRYCLDDLIENENGLLLTKNDALKHPWITGGDARIIRLAFNLYTGNANTALSWERKRERYRTNTEEMKKYLPMTIFCGLDNRLFEAAMEALRLRRYGMDYSDCDGWLLPGEEN